MKIGYVILAHQHPHLVHRLARLLVETGGIVAIHYDAAAGGEPAAAVKAGLKDLADKVLWAERVRVGWGEWSMIEATLNGVNELLSLPEPPDYIQLLSGADFPIRPLADFAAFLARNAGREFIESHAVSRNRWVKGGLSEERYQYRHYFNWKQHPKLFDWNYRLQRGLGLKRKLPDGMEVHFGSQWCTLTRKTWQDISALARRPDILAAFRNSWIPDEMFLQTLIGHLRRPLRNGALTLYQFGGKGVPIVYYDDHLDYLAEQPFFFARKISPHAAALRDALEAIARDPAASSTIEDRRIGRRTAEYRDFCIANRHGRAGRRVVGRVVEEWYGELEWNRNPYLVLVGRCSEELHVLAKLLNETAGLICHGELFANGEIEFAGGAVSYAGYRRRDTLLRDHSRETFLSDVIHAAGERRTGFIYEWSVDERPWNVPLWDRRARFILVTGNRLRAWLEGYSGLGAAARRRRLTPSHFRDWQDLDRSWHGAVETGFEKAKARFVRLDLLEADWLERLSDFLKCLDLPSPGPALDTARARQAAQHLSDPAAALAGAEAYYGMIADPAARRAHDRAHEVNHFGVRIPIDREIMSPRIVEALQSGKYEHKEARELERIIAPGERVLEIGGGLGFISSLVAANPNTAATRVFEADPRLAAFIARVHALNDIPNVGVEAAILSNSMLSPTQPFYVREDFWSSSLSPAPFGYKEVIDVPVRSFSAEIESFAPTLIICDIEGGELELFADANLTGVAKVYIEVHQKVLGRMGMKRLLDAFSAQNFHYDQYHSINGVVLFSSIDRK